MHPAPELRVILCIIVSPEEKPIQVNNVTYIPRTTAFAAKIT